MRNSSPSGLLLKARASSWSDLLVALKSAIETGSKPPDLDALITMSKETLDQTIEEPEHSAKVKKAEIAALLLGALKKHVEMHDPSVVALTFPLSAWTADYKTTNMLGLALLEREGRLDWTGWKDLVSALHKAGHYREIRRITRQHPDADLDSHTQTRVEKSNGALALMDIRDTFRAGRMPAADLFAMAYPHDAQPLVRSIVQSLLDWQKTPGQPLPIALNEASIATPAPAARPLFCGGFRWSGASAVYDFVKGLEGVGTPVRHPRIVSGGAAPLETILDRVLRGDPVDHGPVVDFILEKILGIPPGTQTPKVADLFRRSVIGGAREPGRLLPDVIELLSALRIYALNRDPQDTLLTAGERMRDFYARSAHCPEDCQYIAYDSVMRAWRPDLVQTVKDARMVAVIRDPRDMFVTYLRMERPTLGVKTFLEEFGARLEQYEQGLTHMAIDSQNFRLVRFEDFVLDAGVRQSLCDWLGVANTADVRRGDFIPEQSARNIGVYKTHPDTAAIAEIEKAFPGWCFAAPGDPEPGVDPMERACHTLPAAARQGADETPAPNRLHVLSFSAMASKPMIEDTMSLSGKPGDPGWHVRKGITASLIVEGRYDFVGLQHTQFDTNPAQCGVAQFLSEIHDREPGHYECLNADARFGVESGDSLPIFYDATKWDLVPGQFGVCWFRPSDEAKRRIGGGRFYVYGLFRRKSAAEDDPSAYVWVYNLRLIHKSSDELDQQRTRSLVHVMRHIQSTQTERKAPLVILADTNIKEPHAMANRYLNGDVVVLNGRKRRNPVALVDAFLEMHPRLLNKISSQHNFKPAGSTKGTGRNDRILVSPDVTVQSCSVLTYNHDGNWPSYHFPIEAVLDLGPVPMTPESPATPG
jgi:hypothetical protein